MNEEREGLLSPYRVLDLSDEKGLFCAKVLADLGADVIIAEPPGGCTARKIGPFYNDIPHPEKSLFWFAYSANKRGITLNLECEDGREIFKKLVTTADIIIESFPSGYMKDLGLGYDDLCRIKSDIILISITPFGQDGPYKNFQASDLVCWSMGGFAYLTGDADRPPVQISFPLAYLTGANEASVATMFALYYREISGEGQHVDVSIQASVAKDMMNAPLFWETAGVNLGRAGPFRIGLSLSAGQRAIWKCKDGEVSFFFFGGKAGARTNRALVEYMDEEGMAPDFMKEMEWESFDLATATEELFNNLSHHVGKFFLTHTKKELFREAVKRRMTVYAVQNAADITADPQLKEREFWEGLDHPELGRQLLYPNSPFILSEKLKTKKRRAPLIGEHNEEIYAGKLGISLEEMIKLKGLGVI
jgi:crotonobetainyl-CoA:carnitine CoA-transferase CaiB-like acyl-CoA transferase